MTTSPASDEAIVTRAQAGDTQAFAGVVERYEPKLLRYVRRFIGEPEDARDIAQNVLMKAYTNLQSFDAARRFSPWVYCIAHNEVVNALKRRRPERFSLLALRASVEKKSVSVKMQVFSQYGILAHIANNL